MGAKLGRTFAASSGRRTSTCSRLLPTTPAASRRGRRQAGAVRVVVEGSSDRLGSMLADHGLKGVALAPYWQAAKAADPKKPQRCVLQLDTGFETESLAVISETDILGDRLARPRSRRCSPIFWPKPPPCRPATWWCTSTTASAAMKV